MAWRYGGTDRETTTEAAGLQEQLGPEVKRVDRRRMDELREEIGVQISLTGRLIPIVYSLLAAGCIVD